MRPRVFPAEDAVTPEMITATTTASMRPRVFPAEDEAKLAQDVEEPSPGFNEAAGIPRGRQFLHVQLALHYDSFNEAAGIPRGRR